MPRTLGAKNKNIPATVLREVPEGTVISRKVNYKVKRADGTVVVKTYDREYIKKGRNKSVLAREFINKNLKELNLEQLQSIKEMITEFVKKEDGDEADEAESQEE